MFRFKKIPYVLVVCFVFLYNLFFAQNGEYKFRHISAKEGLLAPSIYSVIKDKKGFIWLASGDVSALNPEIVDQLSSKITAWQQTHAEPLWPSVIYFKVVKDGKEYYFE